MRIFLAGATGALGARLVPLLVDAGHDVTGTTRTPVKAELLRAAGAEPVIADGLDRDAIVAAVVAARPDAIVHQLTALGDMSSLRDFDGAFALTNRLRTEGTENLLAGAREAGARRFVAQSFAGWPYARIGGPVKSEDDPLDPDPVPSMSRTLAAIRRLEQAVTEAGGIALRYGGFYGHGTGMARGGAQVEMIRKRRFPIVGDGGGVWSFVHIDDAAAATLAALERGTPGAIYNIVDDDPAPVREWLPALAAAAGAKPPRRLPRWLARVAAGESVATMMTETRGASNAKARRELGWAPAHPSWREGFRSALASCQKRAGLAPAAPSQTSPRRG
jgi:nucleoside-diphosphate-sugar epimerase